MGLVQFKNNFQGGINLDLDETRVPPDTAQFIKNLTDNANINAAAAGGSGNNKNVRTPMEGNVALSITGIPAGTNYCIGFCNSEQTTEGYFALYNSNDNHTIWVVRGATGAVVKVHQNTLLPFILDPEYFLGEGRWTIELRSVIDPVTKVETNFKFSVFTNNTRFQCLIDVEASIATNSYSTSYFTSSASFYDQLELIHLGSVLPIKCVKLNDPNAYVPTNSDSSIDTAVINSPGTGWVVGATFTIAGGTGGTGKVQTIGVGGAVTSFIITASGTLYSVATSVATSGSGAGLTLDIITLTIPDTSKQNLIINQGWQFRIRTWDVWGRPSEWGIISSVFTSLIGGGCISTSNGLPRCVNLCFDAGSPLIKFITVAYRRGVGNDPNGAVESNWYEHETFRKYDDSTNVQWYQRPISPVFSTAGSGITFNAGTNIITYTFCADKASNPIDEVQASRTQPGLARFSSSVFSVDKKLGLANNAYAFEPIPEPVIENIQFAAKVPSTVSCPAAPLKTIIIYSAIYIPVALLASEHRGYMRTTHGQVGFGRSSGGCGQYGDFSIDQIFGDQVNPGFIGVLRGTTYSKVCRQGDLDPVTGSFTPTGYGAGMSFPHGAVQQYTFTGVPAGKYIMQIASHKSMESDSDIQKTSTYVGGVGVISDLNTPTGMNSFASNPIKEIEIDCSNPSQTIFEFNKPGDPFFIIMDLVIGNGSAAIDGYLYEQNGLDTPIEMNPMYFKGVTVGGTGDVFGSYFTDHNGFYFAATNCNDIYAYAYADVCDGALTTRRQIYGPSNNANNYIHQGVGGITHGDGTGSPSGACLGVHGNWRNKVYLYPTSVSYPEAARRRIKQNVLLCDSPGIGVPGIPVVMTKVGPVGTTDSSGHTTLVAHNRYDYLAAIAPIPASDVWLSIMVPNYNNAPGNRDKLIFSQKGGCEWNACGGCDTFMADAIVTYLICGGSASGCPPGTPARTLCLADVEARPNGIGVYGVQSSAKYPVAFECHDVIGRHTPPQIKGGNLGYVYTPALNDISPSPFPAMALCSLQVTIPPGLLVDPVFKKITFWVGRNCLFHDYFSWAADWIQYVDNTGLTNTSNPTSIRVYYQSLNEYNKQFNFGTNVGWDFIANQADPSQPRDVVQFIMNGDGTWLDPQKGAPITFDKDGSFFTIDYIPELAGLQNGCLFRVVRPTKNITNTNLPYFEQCLTLDINNGLLPAGTYTLPYQDSYLLSRSIPVPRLKGQPGPIPPGPGTAPNTIQITSSNQDNTLDVDGYSTNNLSNTNGVLIFEVKDDRAVFPFFFESPSPSDLWGSHLFTKGRVDFANIYQAQYRVGTEIAVSDALADKGIFNGIGSFNEVNRQIFDRNTFGDITVVLVEMGVIMALCRNDYFIARYNQSQLQVNENGQVMSQNALGNMFTQPQTKVGSNYGLIMKNLNTVAKYNGTVIWLDANGHLIYSNFGESAPMEMANGYLGYLLNKISYINIANNTPLVNGLTYFIGKIDPKTLEYHLSSFNIPVSGSPTYINAESTPVLGKNETMVFDVVKGYLKSFASFTPEYYGLIPGYYLQKQFLSFKNGVPYIHHNNLSGAVPPPLYCNFYGTQCEVRITHIVNGMDGKLLPDKVKRFLYTEIYCRQYIKGITGVAPSALFYADAILSEKGQTSRLLVARWDIKDGYQCAAYICALNTPPDPNMPVATGAHAILDGDPLQGRWMSVSFRNNTAWPGTYFEISEKVDYFNGVEKSAT